jgi:Adenylate and Guanylate cyclase catalytic domain
LAEQTQHYISGEQETREPISNVIYPIVAKKSRAATPLLSDKGQADQLVGLLSTTFYWRSTIRNILPQGSCGVHAVIQNPCTDTFAYLINGPNVEYVGAADVHDASYAKYQHLVRSKNLFDIEASGNNEEHLVHKHAQIEKSHCITTISVHPSDSTRSAYMTNNATGFTIAVVGIFAFTILIFYIYDAVVESRQKTVMETATRSTAIVSSLFPSSVRDRLYPDARISKLDALSADSGAETTSGCPIAELYPETTVMFADIAGFTAWSSARQPGQVFHLLETIYAAFDEIARRRGVFKVETVGDSYVAVAGLPTPKTQHAVVMAIFANECRVKMNGLTCELEKTLGPVRLQLEGLLNLMNLI